MIRNTARQESFVQRQSLRKMPTMRQVRVGNNASLAHPQPEEGRLHL